MCLSFPSRVAWLLISLNCTKVSSKVRGPSTAFDTCHGRDLGNCDCDRRGHSWRLRRSWVSFKRRTKSGRGLCRWPVKDWKMPPSSRERLFLWGSHGNRRGWGRVRGPDKERKNWKVSQWPREGKASRPCYAPPAADLHLSLVTAQPRSNGALQLSLPGFSSRSTGSVGIDGCPRPAEFMACTWNVYLFPGFKSHTWGLGTRANTEDSEGTPAVTLARGAENYSAKSRGEHRLPWGLGTGKGHVPLLSYSPPAKKTLFLPMSRVSP